MIGLIDRLGDKILNDHIARGELAKIIFNLAVHDLDD